MTTDKNNFFYPGATAPGFKIAAQLRGEKEDVVFTSCSSCFQKNLQARPLPCSGGKVHTESQSHREADVVF